MVLGKGEWSNRGFRESSSVCGEEEWAFVNRGDKPQLQVK